MSPDSDGIMRVTVLNAQKFPEDVKDEVRQLWIDFEYGNDVYYHEWGIELDSLNYPIIAEYLTSRGVSECLIHFWW